MNYAKLKILPVICLLGLIAGFVTHMPLRASADSAPPPYPSGDTSDITDYCIKDGYAKLGILPENMSEKDKEEYGEIIDFIHSSCPCMDRIIRAKYPTGNASTVMESVRKDMDIKTRFEEQCVPEKVRDKMQR